MRLSVVAHLVVLMPLAAFVGTCGCVDPPPLDLDVAVGESKPFELLDLAGQPYDLWDAGDRLAVAIFTRTDCPISNRYAPEVGRLYEEFHPRGVDFYLIYVDPREEPEAIEAHLEEYAYPCDALRDPEHSFAAFTGATVTPEAVLFDRQRNIAYRGRIDDRFAELGTMRDEATTHDLADAIAATLEGNPVASPVTKAVGCHIADLRD